MSEHEVLQVQFEAKPVLGYQHITLHGEQSMETLMKAYEVMVNAPDYAPELNCIWDFRRADLGNLTAESIRVLSQFAQESAPDVAGKRRAVLVSADIDFGISRMFELINDDRMPGEFRIFRSLSEAVAWLSKHDDTPPP